MQLFRTIKHIEVFTTHLGQLADDHKWDALRTVSGHNWLSSARPVSQIGAILREGDGGGRGEDERGEGARADEEKTWGGGRGKNEGRGTED